MKEFAEIEYLNFEEKQQVTENVYKIISDSHTVHFYNKDARILKAEKKGKQVYYSLQDNHVKNIIESGLVHMSHGDKNV